MPMPFDLTIITVCRNAAGTIGDTLRSVADQKIAGIEYIIIDGASTDETLALVNEYSAIVDTLVSEPDTGIYDAMNKGAAFAQGRYVCYLNADDSLLPGAIEVLLRHVREYGEVVLFYGDWVGVDHTGLVRHREACLELSWRYRLCHQAMAVRRDLLGTQPFDLQYRICADFDAILCWLQGGVHSMHIPQPLVRFSEGGVSNSSVRVACKETIEIALRRLGLLRTWRFCAMILLHGMRSGFKAVFTTFFSFRSRR